MNKLPVFIVLTALMLMASCKQDKKEDPQKETVTEEVEININGMEVTYATDSTELNGYIAYNENNSEKRPGIVIVHEWWGHNDYVRERADMLAELGYTALAVDMYGNGKQAEHPDDAGKFSSQVMSNLPEAEARFNAALKLLKDHETVDAEQTAAIGYCFGGSVALTMANMGADLDAVAAFHSGVSLPVMPNDKLQARVLVCNGGADPFIPQESVEAFKQDMDSIGANYKYIAYKGVKHSFTSKQADANGEKFDLPLEYNAEADQKSWNELKELLNEVF